MARLLFGSERARALHAESPAVDLHADSLMWSRWVGYDILKRHEAPLPRAAIGGHVDVPRLVEGGVGAQFFGLVSLPVGRHKGLAQACLDQIDALESAVKHSHGRLELALGAEGVEAAGRRGAVAALLGIEGAHALEGELDKLELFARRGVRYLGLVHFSENEVGCPAKGVGRRDAEGLKPFGREVVRRSEELGVLVDLSHLNRKGFLEACAMARVPPVVSHTGVLGAFEHWRNVDDAQLRAVAEKGGCVGVIFCPHFLGGDGLEPVVRHLRHIVDVCGEDTPALGSDWDGFIVPTRELKDAARLPLLTDALLEAGFSESAVRKILRENAMRVLRSAARPALRAEGGAANLGAP